MANTRLSMRKIKEVLRLTYHGGLSARQVARSLNISRSTAKEYQEGAERAGLGWPLPNTLSDQQLEQKLFPPAVTVETPVKARPDPHYVYHYRQRDRAFATRLGN